MSSDAHAYDHDDDGDGDGDDDDEKAKRYSSALLRICREFQKFPHVEFFHILIFYAIDILSLARQIFLGKTA